MEVDWIVSSVKPIVGGHVDPVEGYDHYGKIAEVRESERYENLYFVTFEPDEDGDESFYYVVWLQHKSNK